jgi:hypothetical protein
VDGRLDCRGVLSFEYEYMWSWEWSIGAGDWEI